MLSKNDIAKNFTISKPMVLANFTHHSLNKPNCFKHSTSISIISSGWKLKISML